MARGMALRDSAQDIATDITAPVLVVGGTYDPVVPKQETERMAGAFPAAQLVWMEASGHVPMLEEEGRLAEVLSAFTGG